MEHKGLIAHVGESRNSNKNVKETFFSGIPKSADLARGPDINYNGVEGPYGLPAPKPPVMRIDDLPELRSPRTRWIRKLRPMRIIADRR